MKRYILPLINQGVVAAFNLTLQLLLIRLASSEDFGTFVLWQSMVMIMVGFQDAMIGVPLSLRIAFDPTNARRFVLERQVAAFAAIFVAGAAAILLVALLVVGDGLRSPLLGPAVALYAASFLAYYAVRFLAQSRAQFGKALVIDSAYSLMSLTAVGLLAVTFGTLPLVPLFAALSLPAAAAAVIGYAILERPPAPRSRRMLQRYATIWRDTRWTVAAVAASELQNRAFIFVISALYGSAALAGVFAGTIVLRHIVLVMGAWTAFARPFLVGMRDRGATTAMLQFSLGSAAVLMAMLAVNLVILAVAWPLIDTYIYGAKYSDMWSVVVLWTIVYALQAPVMPLAMVLVTLGRYREDSTAVMIGSTVTVTLVTVLAATFGPQTAVVGMGAGYVITCAIMGWRIAQELGRRRAMVAP
ncbi:polysaccharide biosynthesis protein [Acuticoccus mangrovi]|uniref:O-antigen/teichoic acid export membrane protein n=1 Tax=Acuticoccus mangrovi TaxID=2796142 RepID=A0A934IPC9_9HYPH|nr:hypothetical protein [Acuticoccus mangrovi]MBJ3778591.1 hypothetical protein [Acuticoccus mangrovi]